MKKTRLNRHQRQLLRDYGNRKIAEQIDRTREIELYNIMLSKANEAIRAKYPETDMAIIRKYNLERVDRCLRFQFPNGRVDGFSFACEQPVFDLPHNRGCHYGSDVFVVDADFEAAFDEHAKVHVANITAKSDQQADFAVVIDTAVYVDDVLEIIPVPDDIRRQLLKGSTALIALSPELVDRVKANFTAAVAA